MSRTVTLVLADPAGAVLGALPSYEVAQPWWPSMEDVGEGARRRFGLSVTVLRLLNADRDSQPGGSVTYLAQATGDLDGRLEPVDEHAERLATADDPNRADYARPGGPQATLAWASEELAERGRGPVVAVTQCKTWNLSSIWRLETPTGPVWIKEVPHFFGHEPAMLGWLAARGHGSIAPRLIASQGRRMLLEHISGVDLFGADTQTRLGIAADMHRIQSTADVDDLIAIGVPDRRKLATRLADVARTAQRTDARLADPRLDRLLDGLDERFDRIVECGLPDTVVHGDLHPGNAVGTAESRVILDWGDCVIGNPAFDILRLTEGLPDSEADPVRLAWAGWWREAVAGCDPLRAVALMQPVAPLYGASVYANFLANIEASEHPYHGSDVPDCLIRAAELAG